MRLLHHLQDRVFVLQNTNHFDIGLIGDCRHYEFAHQSWSIRHQNVNFRHAAPLDQYRRESGKEQVQLGVIRRLTECRGSTKEVFLIWDKVPRRLALSTRNVLLCALEMESWTTS